MDMDDFPAVVAFDEDAAFVVGAVLNACFGGDGEHEGVTDDGRIAIKLQARFPQVITKIAIRSGPTVVNHEEMKVEAILPVRGDEPFVEG